MLPSAVLSESRPVRATLVPGPTFVDDGQVARAALAVAAGLDPSSLSRELQARLQAIGGLTGDLRHVATQVGDAVMQRAVFETTAAIASTIPIKKGHQPPERDWFRQWGLQLISTDHPKLRDGAYLTRFLSAAGQLGTAAVAASVFEDALKDLAPSVKVLAYTSTGSDASSLAYSMIAKPAAEVRMGRSAGWDRADGPRPPRMAFFTGTYGGGRGLALGMNWRGYDESRAQKRFALPLAATFNVPVTDPAEAARLDAVENQALADLRRLAADRQDPIGAIYFEPVLGTLGVRRYRTEFVMKLRALADELGLPIIADEILTGGGRTGKFFSYEHYEGFQPDFVLFGKGMQACGIAHVEREGQSESQRIWDGGVVTVPSDPAALIRGAQVLSIIRDEGLVDRAAELGRRLQAILREVQTMARDHKLRYDPERAEEVEATALGCLAAWRAPASCAAPVEYFRFGGESRNRLMPPLDLPFSVLDEIRDELLAKLAEVVRADERDIEGTKLSFTLQLAGEAVTRGWNERAEMLLEASAKKLAEKLSTASAAWVEQLQPISDGLARWRAERGDVSTLQALSDRARALDLDDTVRFHRGSGTSTQRPFER